MELTDDCTCKDLINREGVGNCKGKKPSQYNGTKFACYVKLPSTCTDLSDSITDNGEKLSTEPCYVLAGKIWNINS